jgi:hypothetical protein
MTRPDETKQSGPSNNHPPKLGSSNNQSPECCPSSSVSTSYSRRYTSFPQNCNQESGSESEQEKNYRTLTDMRVKEGLGEIEN